MNSIIVEGKPIWAEIEKQTWAKAMQNCLQEPDYHAEGDVLTHTKMVVNELLNITEYQELASEEKELVLLSAIFHDIAKPKSIIITEGKIGSPGHSKLGEKLVRELFWDWEFEKREHLSSLVRLHGLPVWSIEKANINQAIILSSLRVKNNLLYLLAKADMLGRISEHKEHLVLNVELFKELCLDSECFYQEALFYNNHSKFKFYGSQDKYPAQLYDNTEFEVIILSGLPGSGKDTYANNFELPIISLDELRKKYKIQRGDKKAEGRMIKEAYELAKEFCRKKQNFIWNSTNLTYEMRSKIINTIKVYNPKIKIVYLETSLANVHSRRKGEIDRQALTRMFNMLDIPQKYEAHEVEYLRT